MIQSEQSTAGQIGTKNLYQYITVCVTCQTRNLRKVEPPQQETDAPLYPFAKLRLDISRPYYNSLTDNKYMNVFVDWYSGWPESFTVPDKTAETVVHLLLEEIVQRYSTPLQIVTDNCNENINCIMKHTLQEMNISHITTSYYHP